jgi:hypothetical protein
MYSTMKRLKTGVKRTTETSYRPISNTSQRMDNHQLKIYRINRPALLADRQKITVGRCH